MKAIVTLNLLALFVGTQIGLSAKEPVRFPPRFMFPGELQKVHNTFSIEELRQRCAQEETPLPVPRPVPIPLPEFNPNPEGSIKEFERNPVELLGIEPWDEEDTDGDTAAPQ